jgi:integrase/recombinase XerD
MEGVICMAVALKINQKHKQVTLKSALEEFIRFTNSKNRSEKTVSNYRKEFSKFMEWYGEDGDIHSIDSDTIISYIEYLKSQGSRKAVSINTALRHLKAIFNYWSLEKNYFPPFRIHMLETQEEPKEVYTNDQLSILTKKPSKYNFQELRTWAIINFFVGTGCRVGTLINILIKDIDWDGNFITYRHTKSKKLQYIPISPSLRKVLQDWLEERGGESNDFLFPSEDDKQLYPTTVTHNIKAYIQKRGLDRDGNSHLFRHTYAKNWILRGGDSIKLMHILGHSSLDMVEHYANLYGHDLHVGFEDYDLLTSIAKNNTKLTVNKKRK